MLKDDADLFAISFHRPTLQYAKNSQFCDAKKLQVCICEQLACLLSCKCLY